jgi:pilus assembly protein CpaE
MRTIVVVPDPALNDDLMAALAAFREIEVVRQIPHYPTPENLLRIVRARQPDFVCLSTEDFTQFQALAAIVDERLSGLPIVSVASDANPIELIPKLMHLGVRELLTSPVTHEKLAETIASVSRQLARHPAPRVPLGDLCAFFPAKPGVGATTLALSTSCAMADELHLRTLLLDCDLMAGVTKFLLKLGNNCSIVNALEHADTLDEDMWSQIIGHWGDLEVLHAGELAPPANLSAGCLEVVLGIARGQYDSICADLASSLDPFTVQVMREARRIFLVTTPELVSLYMAADRLRHLKGLGLGGKVSLLLTRKDQAQRSLSDVEASKLVGLPIAFEFFNDYSTVQSSILDGVPVAQNSNLGRSIMSLAQSLAPAVARQEVPVLSKRKFLQFFHVPSVEDPETAWQG